MPWSLQYPVLRHILNLLPNIISICTHNTAFLPPFHRSHHRRRRGETESSSVLSNQEITVILGELQHAYDNGRSRPIEWRRQQMRQLWALIDENEAALQEVLYTDNGKSKLEAQIYELGGLKNEILYMLQNFEDWLKPEIPIVPDMFQAYQPSILKEPKGVVFIISPWNYPIVLLLLPLLGAIAAGNCAILKPSEFTPNVTTKLAELIPQYLDRDCFRVVQGGKEVVKGFLQHPLGHIFFTGSTSVGKSIMIAASKHLTTLTLELGGKSPAIVTESANIAQAAKRIAWGKFLNAGQTCVAPDYALIQESILPQFLQELEKVMETTYAHDSQQLARCSRSLDRMHLKRLNMLLYDTGGTALPSTPIPHPKYISEYEFFRPTSLVIPPIVFTNLQPASPLLQREVFGPFLPILSFRDLSDFPATIRGIDPAPLATYIFTSQKDNARYLNEHIASGTTCINDVMGHMAVTSLPFGGRGNSGFGSYRGKASIECFSAKRTVVDVPTSDEFEDSIAFRYPGGNDEEKFKLWKEVMEGKKDW